MRPLLFCCAMLATLLGSSGVASMAGPADQREELANKLVHDVLHVAAGQIVVVTADSSQMDLVDDIALAVREAGGFVISDIGSNRVKKLYYRDVPSIFDRQRPEDMLALASVATAFINIAYPYDRTVTLGVSPERLHVIADAATPFREYMLAKNIVEINVGNGVFPSAGNSARFGVSQDALSRLFWSGVNADYDQIRRDALRVGAIADGSHRVRITAPNGTNFTFVTVPGSAIMNNGSISAEDLRRGGAALDKQLPAGDVYVLPDPGSATGTLVFGTAPLSSGNLVGMTMTFTNGVLTSMKAAKNEVAVQKVYDAAGAGRDRFSFADFGVNRSIEVGPGTWGAGPSMAAGYVTVGIGNNLHQGGSDDSSFLFSSNIPNATVTVDGKPIITSGKLL